MNNLVLIVIVTFLLTGLILIQVNLNEEIYYLIEIVLSPGLVSNFEKYNYSESLTLGTLYDYESVMHYDRYSFAINSSVPTILPTQNTSASIGGRSAMSLIDIFEIQKWYGCIPNTST